MIIFGNETMKVCFRESDGMLMSIDSKYGKTSFENHIWAVNCGDSLCKPEDMDSFTAVPKEDSLNLIWTKGEEKVCVVLTKGENIRWRIFVNVSVPVSSVDFPIFKALPAKHDLLLGWQNGSVIKDFVDSFLALDKEVPFWMGRGKGAYINEYPAGISYQYSAYYDEKFGLYFAHEDGEAYIKTYSYLYNKEAHGMDYVVTNYPENAGIATVYYMPYDFVADTFTGDWRDATLKYRQWATQQKWCTKKLSERKLPETVTDVNFWRINHTNPPLGMRYEEYFNTCRQLQKEIDPKLAIHWYGWNKQTHGYGYPNMVKKEDLDAGWMDEVASMNRRFTENGIRKIPYINTRLWIEEDPSFKEEGADKAVVMNNPTESNAEPWTKGVHHRTICPATPIFQQKNRQVCAMVKDSEFDGVYIDQIASFNAMLCFDKNHNHPVGGGNWWGNSNRSMLRYVRNLMTAYRIMTTESCCELYTDCFDLLLILDPNNQKSAFNAVAGKTIARSVPLYNMIYGDYGLTYGSICTLNDRPECYAFNFMRNLLWGIIPSVDGFTQEELDREESRFHLQITKTAVEFYKENKALFLYGRLVNVLDVRCESITLHWDIRNVGTCQEEEKAVLAVLWESADGGRCILAANVTEKEQIATIGGKAVIVPAYSFVKL